MDPRIGILMREGKPVYYAFVDGHGKPETVGTLEQIETALGLRKPAKVKKVKPKVYREYLVTMTQSGESDALPFWAYTASEAISDCRRFWNNQDGRTRTCMLDPRSFRARLSDSK